MFDTHCHLQFNAYKDDHDDVLKRCVEKEMILNVVGSQKDTSRRAVEYAEKYDNIFATVGLHPIHLFKSHVDESEAKFDSRAEDFDYEFYKKLAQNKKVIAIGECGLDFFHQPEGASQDEVFKKQKEVFLKQHELAVELNLPLVIHVRNAHDEMIELLVGLHKKINGTVHCYTSNWARAQQYLDLGLHLGFTGVITFPPKKTNSQSQLDMLEVVAKCPTDRMLVETDAPYLAPQAYRGQRCEPWMVEEVAKKIAEIKKLSFAEVVETTAKNAEALFLKMP